MNLGTFCAAGILAVCAIYNAFSGGTSDAVIPNGAERFWKYGFLALNLTILTFCAFALFNARASFSFADQTFTYFKNYSPALPTTYDANLTRQTFINWAAAFCAFWALRYWILAGWRSSRHSAPITALSNMRLRTALWTLSMNGFAISLQGILQRLSGTNKLLWVRKAYVEDPLAAFGSFAYRGNAVEYINLLWPLALAFWWVLSRERRRSQGSHRVLTDGPELLLIPAVVVMVAAAFTTLSRGGVIIAAGSLLGALLLLVWQRSTSKLALISSAAVLFAVAALVLYLGIDKVLARFRDSSLQTLSGRTEIFENSRKITQEFPLFGAGPGAFSSVYHLYRDDASQLWHAWVHDDWLETRVTMGWVGFSLVLLNLLFLFAWIFSPGRPPIHFLFPALASLGLFGCLLKAKFDFPMQTYSIFYSFVSIAAILATLSPVRR